MIPSHFQLTLLLFIDKELVGTANWLHDEVPVLMPELAPALEGIADTGYPPIGYRGVAESLSPPQAIEANP